jgi:hypothetical protein
MSLFDDNYLSMKSVLEAKEADEDTEKKDAEDESADDEAKDSDDDAEDVEEVDLPDVDAAAAGEDEDAAKEALEIDVNAETMEGAIGMSSLIENAEEDVHMACMEAVSAAILFDQSDAACAEAYKAATSEYEKQIVTEKFTETVKKYAERFKQFLIKIKNAIVRIFSKVWNYIKILAAKVNVKFSLAMKIDTKKYQIKKGTKVRVNKVIANTLKAGDATPMLKNAEKAAANGISFEHIMSLIDGISKKSEDKDYTKFKNEVNKIKVKDTDEIMKAIYGTAEIDLKLEGQENLVKDIAKKLPNAIKKGMTVVDKVKKEMDKCVEAAKKHVDKLGDIDTGKINIMTAAINKAMSLYNKNVNACVKSMLLMVNTCARIVRAAGWASEEKEKKSDKKKGAKESFVNLFNDYMEMVD